MATKPLNKQSKPSNKNKTIEDFEKDIPNFREAVFNYEDCKELFGEKLKVLHMPVSDDTKLIVAAFNKLLPELSDTSLNLTNEEYESLFELLQSEYTGEYPQHIGIWALLPKLIIKSPGGLYSANNGERLAIYKACTAITKTAWDLQQPARDEAIAEFWAVATLDQIDEIRDTARHRNNPRMMGMPGNQ